MKYIYIGKIVNTHGIRGEVRIISDFKYKDKIFNKNMNIYIGKDKCCEVINTYRVHKNFDMITMDGYDNINQILKYKGMNVYVNSDDIIMDENEYLDSDLVDMNVLVDNEIIGKVIRVERYSKNNLLVINDGSKDILVPFVDEFVLKIDLINRCIYIKYIEGLF